jgi:hypothetical protein
VEAKDMSFSADLASYSATDITMGVDPGLNGGLAILLGGVAVVHSPPIITSKVKKRTKGRGLHEVVARDYDLAAMHGLLKPFEGQNVLFAIERVMATSRDSSYSMFSFGEGVGYWKMAAVACGFKLIEITSVEWKKHYPEMLDTVEINTLRGSISILRGKDKVAKGKAEKGGIKKEMSALSRELKGHAKDAARFLATKLYPDVAESFKLKKDDGKAEAVLIARYAQAHYR